MPRLDNFSLANFGFGGPDGGVKYASGVKLASSTTSSAPMRGGSSVGRYDLTVTGLSFRPNRIIIRPNDISAEYVNFLYSTATRNATDYNYGFEVTANGGYGYVFTITEATSATTAMSTVHDSGFKLPVYSGSINYVWEAFRV